MKIVFLCNEYPPLPHGGIGTFVQTMARAFAARGHLVQVVGLGAAAARSSDGNITVTTLPASRTRFVGNFFSRLRLRRWLGREVREGRCNLIEVPDYLGLLPFRVRGAASVVRLHISTTAICQHAGWRVPKGISYYERKTLASNPYWIGVSKYMLESTERIFGLKPRLARLVYNSVPSPPPQIARDESLPEQFVLYAGHVSRRKGAVLLARAMKPLLESRPQLRLVYIGGEVIGAGEPRIQEQILQEVGPALAGQVLILGRQPRERVLSAMKQCSVFAFPSTLEALGLVVLEAMSVGAPVVCTSIPPGPEMVDHGSTGLLADPNVPSDFAEKIASLLDDRELARRVAANAAELLRRRFTLEQCVTESEAFYKECLSHLSLRSE
ncbi:MAG TPA: glycosyltransferase family 4 protein [Dongiaceae bacterium]|nr:glycosyltransferase family 4 protein [Dongiaceae bacterium]